MLNEELDSLENIKNYYLLPQLENHWGSWFSTIENALKEKEKQDKVLEVLRKKPYGLTHAKVYETYDEYCESCFRQYNPLTLEEFDLLKEVLL